MNEAQMQSLVCAIELGSINAAARELFVTPPSLHQRLAALEEELGCPLLERDRRGVRPTEAGRRLYAACLACLAELDGARLDIARLQAPNYPHEVRIGVSWRPSLRTYYAIEALHERCPDLAVSAVKVVGKTLIEALTRGEIDLFEGPRLAEQPAGLAFWSFGEDTYRCVCGPESRWSCQDVVTPDMLEGATVYAGSDYRSFFSYRKCESVQRLCTGENFKREVFPTERIVADCLSGSAVVLFTAKRADDLCPPLVHVTFDIPPVEIGAFTRVNPGDDVRAVVEALRG